jgi:hypothetical protein
MRYMYGVTAKVPDTDTVTERVDSRFTDSS